MQVVLVMFRSDGGRKSFSVTRDVVVVGRREDCDLRIPLGEVSRKHCRFVKDGDALRVEDLGSSNGTFINGQKLFPDMPAPVQDSAGTITNQPARVAALEQACYQCHPTGNKP